jgi:hypothetical protein
MLNTNIFCIYLDTLERCSLTNILLDDLRSILVLIVVKPLAVRSRMPLLISATGPGRQTGTTYSREISGSLVAAVSMRESAVQEP